MIGGLDAVCTLPKILHGKVLGQTPVHEDDVREIVCNSGYKLSGSAYITCKPDGSWAPTYGGPSIPECIGKSKLMTGTWLLLLALFDVSMTIFLLLLTYSQGVFMVHCARLFFSFLICYFERKIQDQVKPKTFK